MKNEMELPEPVQQTINNLDLQGASIDEVVQDIADQSNQFAFRLLIASAILKRLSNNIKPASNEGEEHLQPDA